MQSDLIIRKSEVIEVLIGANTSQTSFSFPQNNENIEKGFVYGLESFSAAQLTKSPSGLDIVAANIFSKAYLVLAVDNAEDIYQIPLFSLNPTLNAGIIRQLDGVKINFTKSKVIIPDSTGLVANTSFFFNFYYRNEKLQLSK